MKVIFSPLFLIISFIGIGLLLVILRKKCGLAKYFLTIGFICLCLLSFRPFSNFLIWRLESRYSPFNDFTETRNVKYIVVLTAWDSNNPTVPYTSNIGYRSALRVLEAHRIYTHMPQCDVIISGSKAGTHLMSMLMTLLGVPPQKVITDFSESTWNSALNIKNLVSDHHFILVTSAIHLPRSMGCFIRQELKPIPAPADFSYGNYQVFKVPFDKSLSYYLPHANIFLRSHLALYEYSAILWYNIKGLY